MEKKPDPFDLLQTWCKEAVSEFGDDWPKIHLYINAKLAELPDPQRIEFLQKVELLLAPPRDGPAH
jgi:hypothetical protein